MSPLPTMSIIVTKKSHYSLKFVSYLKGERPLSIWQGSYSLLVSMGGYAYWQEAI